MHKNRIQKDVKDYAANDVKDEKQKRKEQTCSTVLKNIKKEIVELTLVVFQKSSVINVDRAKSHVFDENHER